MGRDSGRDIREEVRIAIFWRALIGDYEYVKFNPDDMLRWYDALELRGPDEIRLMMTERYSTRPVRAMLGVVTAAPHPPVWLVREWLAHYEQKLRTGHLWTATAGFLVLSFMAFPALHGCADLTPVNMYVMNPPSGGPQVSAPQAPVGSNFNPALTEPPAVFTPSVTGPKSGGIAGAATGASPAGGTTGATNGGLSAGATSAAPAVGGTQQ